MKLDNDNITNSSNVDGESAGMHPQQQQSPLESHVNLTPQQLQQQQPQPVLPIEFDAATDIHNPVSFPKTPCSDDTQASQPPLQDPPQTQLLLPSPSSLSTPVLSIKSLLAASAFVDGETPLSAAVRAAASEETSHVSLNVQEHLKHDQPILLHSEVQRHQNDQQIQSQSHSQEGQLKERDNCDMKLGNLIGKDSAVIIYKSVMTLSHGSTFHHGVGDDSRAASTGNSIGDNSSSSNDNISARNQLLLRGVSTMTEYTSNQVSLHGFRTPTESPSISRNATQSPSLPIVATQSSPASSVLSSCEEELDSGRIYPSAMFGHHSCGSGDADAGRSISSSASDDICMGDHDIGDEGDDEDGGFNDLVGDCVDDSKATVDTTAPSAGVVKIKRFHCQDPGCGKSFTTR
jgi:hypothetical protein